MKNYWVELAKLRKQIKFTVEVILRFDSKSLKQIKENEVQVINNSNSQLEFSYYTLDLINYNEIAHWMANKNSVRKCIVRLRKYDGLGELLRAWDIVDPKADFGNFSQFSYEIGLKFSQMIKVK